jgi:hypothetical protein
MKTRSFAALVAGALVWAGPTAAQPSVAAEYSNDKTANGGRTDGCILDARMPLAAPTEQLDVQLLAFSGLIGWRAAVSRLGPAGKPVSAGSVADVRFLDAGDIGPPHVRRANKPDGQLMAYLVDMGYAKPVIASFFRGAYAIDVVAKGGPGKRSYRVRTAPSKAVREAFRACVDEITRR